MNVLVTGGAGYIGSHTCKALAEAGHTPVAFDNLSMGHRWAVQWGPLVEADLADSRALREVLEDRRIDAVMHFAGSALVGESMRDPERYFSNNVVNTLNLLAETRRAGVRELVFSSSCATYGIPEEIPIREEHPQKPVNPYGESKLAVERILRWYGEAYGLRWAALRYFNAAGADADGVVGESHDPETHLIPLVLQAATGERRHVDVFGTDYDTPDGTCVRDYVHVSDLARAHVLALEKLRGGAPSICVNLGGGIGNSVWEVIAAVERISGRSVAVVESPRRPGDPAVLRADVSRAEAVLGWKAEYADLDEIVRTAWRWETLHRPRISSCSCH
jgi:UDP-arabinose 4-epimerase